MQKHIFKKELLIIFVLIGLLGSIMFSPVKMESGKTCLFHKIIGGEVDQMSDKISIMQQNHETLKRYLIPFGFVWWFSIFMFATSFYLLVNSKQRRHYENLAN
jgi:hypothetical protein